MSSTRPEQVLRVVDVLDIPAARSVQAGLSSAPAGARISLDLTGVRVCEDAALAVLAVALRRCGASRVAVRGLGVHQLRLMRYLGLDLESRQASA